MISDLVPETVRLLTTLQIILGSGDPDTLQEKVRAELGHLATGARPGEGAAVLLDELAVLCRGRGELVRADNAWRVACIIRGSVGLTS